MGHNNFFRFKQFNVTQEKSAMKVGTDGVLLGAWTKVDGTEKNILDIGAGTGLIALMLAQRSNAKVTAVEIDREATSEAAENFKISPWRDRLSIVNCSFQEFAQKSTRKFDLIVTNPPYFFDDFKSAEARLKIARHCDELPFNELVTGIGHVLTTNGRISVILPHKSAKIFSEIAGLNGFYMNFQTEVRPNPVKQPNRVLMQFTRTSLQPVIDSLTIHENGHLDYSEAYKTLTREFYLNF